MDMRPSINVNVRFRTTSEEGRASSLGHKKFSVVDFYACPTIVNGKAEEFGRWMSRNGPNPRGIPFSVVEAEIAYPGTTGVRVILNENGNVITIIPGGK